MQETPKRKSMSWTGILLGIICLAAVLITIIRNSVVRVEEGERGVVISPYSSRTLNGYLDDVLVPGLNLIVPGERVRIYDVSSQIYTQSSPDSIRARTLDGKEVYIEISINYALDPNKIIDMHINWQNRYEDELIRPLSRGVIRDAISNSNSFEIDAQFSRLESVISKELEMEFNKNSLLLVKFTIISIQSSE